MCFQAEIEKCTTALTAILPELLKGISDQFLPAADSEEQPDSTFATGTTPHPLQVEDLEDLTCQEELLADQENSPPPAEMYTLRHHHPESPSTSVSGSSSRSSSPLSAVDIFTEYNTNVLKAIFDQVEQQEAIKPAVDQPAENIQPLKPSTNNSSSDKQADHTILLVSWAINVTIPNVAPF